MNRLIITLILLATAVLSVLIVKAGTGAMLPLIYGMAGFVVYGLATDPHRVKGDEN